MSTLLRPQALNYPDARSVSAQAPAPDRWVSTQVPAPARWLERTRRAPQSWTVRSRRWDPPSSPVRDLPVVLVHGLVIASSMCVPLARRLAVDGVVHAPDLPGFGRSEKPRPTLDVPELGDALTEWVRRAIGTPAVLVGVSLGAQIALSAAVREPSAWAGVALVSPTFDRGYRRWRHQLPRWQREQATQSMGLRARQVRDYLRAGVPRALRTARAGMRDAPEDHITELSVPAVVCRGGRDPLVSETWARELAHHSGARLALVPDAAHNMSYENPLELSRVINGFIDQLTERDTRSAAR